MAAHPILDQLSERFPALDLDQEVSGARRLFVAAPLEALLDVLHYAKEELGFTHLAAITGLHVGVGYEFLYHVVDQGGTVLSVKMRAEGTDDVVIPSVLPVHEGATFYERELEGLLGVRVEGLPAGRQYPLPDNWPKGEYPMRKDWVPASARKQE